MESAALTDDQRALLIEALVEPKPFYGEGIWTAPSDQLNLFLAKEPYRLSLCKDAATEADLHKLAAACDPATFGMNQLDVLDESYRKAGKLDKTDFALNLDIVGNGLLQAVYSALFDWEDNPRGIKAELYKLNVYGPGSFFKSHKDTPRGDDMFGSLVLNFPTKHEGGALVLRHDGREVVHDASAAAYTGLNQVSWVAFYSDVEHEVLPVQSGYRITLTYNLYFAAPPAQSLAPPVGVEPLLDAFKRLLQDPAFFPDGGRLGFALKHQYPVPANSDSDMDEDSMEKARDVLRSLTSALKGGDRALFQAASAVGLQPVLRLAYELEYAGVYLLDHVFEGGYQVDSWSEAMDWTKGEHVEKMKEPSYRPMSEEDEARLRKNAVQWVTPRESTTRVKTDYVAYGNDASLASVYGDLVLIATVPPHGDRMTA